MSGHPSTEAAHSTPKTEASREPYPGRLDYKPGKAEKSRRKAKTAAVSLLDGAGGKDYAKLEESEVTGTMAKRGAPRKYKSAQAMQDAIDAYFEDCRGEVLRDADGRPILDKYSQPILQGEHPPTVTGLALALGFTGRQALLDYQARPEFTDTVTRAKARCEAYAEERLYDKDGANGAKFNLSCNFGWSAKTPESAGAAREDDDPITRALKEEAGHGL